MRRDVVLVLALALLGLASVFWGHAKADQTQGNIPLEPAGSVPLYKVAQITSATRLIEAVAAVDSTGVGAWTSLPEVLLGNRQNLKVGFRSSSAAGSVTYKVGWYYKAPDGTLTFQGETDATTVSVLGQDPDGDYVIPDRVFDAGGANCAKVGITARTGGSRVEMWARAH